MEVLHHLGGLGVGQHPAHLGVDILGAAQLVGVGLGEQLIVGIDPHRAYDRREAISWALNLSTLASLGSRRGDTEPSSLR